MCNQEGGFAATVLGLMSSNKLQFRTEVPEQLVVLDPNMASVDENYVRILQRYKELLKNAGSMDETDIEMMRSPSKQITSTALFSKRMTASESETSDRESQERELSADSVNKIMNYGARSQVVFQEGEGDGDSRSNTTLAKSASRIALYMMREEMKESPLESNPVQHSHDFFVISSCSVHGKLYKPVDPPEENIVTYNGMTINKNTLPGDYDSIKSVLSSFALDVNGKSGRGTQKNLTNRNIVPLKIDLEAIKSYCIEDGWTENDISNLMRFRDFVDSFGFKGADKKQVSGFQMLGVKVLPLERILEASLKHFLLIEVGVVSTRFVSHAHSKEWLLHSFKLNRASEAVESVKYSGKLYQGHGPLEEKMEEEAGKEETSVSCDVQREHESKKDTDGGVSTRPKRTIKVPRKNSLDANEGGEDIMVNPRRKNPGVGVKMTREVQEACDKINWGRVEEVLVSIRPWVRVDGTLNRRVLDRLVGAMLGVIMQTPAQTLACLTQRFSPAIQPVHSRQLIIFLADLKCVSIIRVSRPPPVSLFSKPSITKFSEAGILDDDSELVVEAEVDAIVKLGMFIGDKVYSTDFASQCPCHPDRRM